jgi:hypothetical protein
MRLAELFSRAPEPEPEAVKPQEPTPQFITKDDLVASQTALMDRITGLAERFIPQPGPAAPQAPVPTVTVADVETALQSGEGAANKIAGLINDRVNAAVHDVRTRELNPLRNVGMNTLEQVARNQVVGALPNEHKRFLPEVEALVKEMPAEVRADPQTWKTTLAMVVGTHTHELIAEAREQALRTASEPRAESAPRNAEIDMGEGKRLRVPSIEEFAGEEGIAALQERGKGMNADSWAQAAGYDSWSDYIKIASKYDEPIDEYPNVAMGSKTFSRGTRGPHAGN